MRKFKKEAFLESSMEGFRKKSNLVYNNANMSQPSNKNMRDGINGK